MEINMTDLGCVIGAFLLSAPIENEDREEWN